MELGERTGVPPHPGAKASATLKNAKGNEAFWKKDYTSALELYSAAIAEYPECPLLYSNRSSCHLKTGNTAAALQDAEECVSLDPSSVIGWLSVGHCRLVKRDFGGVMQALQQAKNADPDNLGVLNAMAAAAALQSSLKQITDPAAYSKVKSVIAPESSVKV